MAKKLLISFAIIILSVCCSICCFAANENSNMDLGGEISNSLDKTGQSMRNVTGSAMNGINHMMGDDNYARDDNSRNNGYNAVRTSTEDVGMTNMSTTTWIWIILAVAAIVIVAMVWYYAVQDNGRD